MGNADMGDDAIGVHLVERLRREMESGAWKPPTSLRVECTSAGRDSVLAGACLMEAAAALLIDAADMNAEAGEYRVFSLDDADFNGHLRSASAHALPLGDVLELVRGMDADARIRLMGIQPAQFDEGAPLSVRLAERVPEMLMRIKEEVSLLP
jgi:hydrogenase maturation protease